MKDLTVCVIDNGLHSAWAERLARDAGRLLYWKPWVTSFPTRHVAAIGTGLKNVEVIKDLDDYEREIDLFVFLDVHFAELQVRLANAGKLVFGARRGEELELHRWYAKEMMKEVGLPVGRSWAIDGMDNLRDFLRKHDDVWIKVSEFRGIGETWHHQNYALSKPRLDKLEGELGPLSDIQEFIVEEPIETVGEVGWDGYVVRGTYPSLAIAGYEAKDVGYVGAVMPYHKLPGSIKTVNEKLQPVFEQYDYRGFFSSEIREGKDGKPYLVDCTARVPSPPGALYLEWMENLSEIILATAKGELVEPKFTHPYGVELILYSEAADNWLGVQYPSSVAKYVKLYNEYRDSTQSWIVPTDAKLVQVGGVLGFGDTIKEAFQAALEVAEKVKGDGLCVKKDSIPQLLDTLRAAKEQGVYFGESIIPDKI